LKAAAAVSPSPGLVLPDGARAVAALIVLAGLATVIAAQAVITGAFSLTQQAIQLGLLPRLRVRQTSADFRGRSISPRSTGCCCSACWCWSSSSRPPRRWRRPMHRGDGTMVVTTCLAYLVVRHRWGWSRGVAVAALLPFLALDLVFFGANILRVIEGAGCRCWSVRASGSSSIPGCAGGYRLGLREAAGDPLADLAAALAKRPPERVPGTAVFLTANPPRRWRAAPQSEAQQDPARAESGGDDHTADRPVVPPERRAHVERLDDNFATVTLTYGFMETPDVPRDLKDLGVETRHSGLDR
jgi:KUP system potassium uptake protein